ncbi:MAG TPA: hypothetical protein VIM87_14445 [Chitinophaga sp.]|uniref:hypothetical protein n=1 Tax=Chitinophaga sp. TaxID=1869181 RepID=UPI002F95A276
MSELRSLFVKLKIKKENLERFLKAKPTTPVPDEDWTSWWDSRNMYSKSPLIEIPVYSKEISGDIFESYLDTEKTLSREKHEEGVYFFTSVLFAENYYEILPMLAVLKSIALYMEPGDEGVAFIYDYFWGGDDVMAHLELSAGQAVLRDTKSTVKINKQLLMEANKVIQDVMDVISAKYKN